MQVKLIKNAREKFSEIENLKQSWTTLDLETFEFLQNNEWKEVYYHHKLRPDWLCEVSEYEKTKKYEIPLELIILEEIIAKQEILRTLFDKYNKQINILAIIFVILLLSITYIARDKTKPIIKEKTAIEINIDTQKMNLDLIQEKLKKQKIIKWRIKDLQTDLNKNISDIKTLEINNSNLREQYILETNK
jgi:hypothetical protein